MFNLESMILQVALDFLDMGRALKVAKEVSGSADWLEAGTPLIKANGMDAIRQLKKAFPDKQIVADLKIADTGDIETEMAAKAGADVVTVLGNADDQTIIHAVEAAKNFGCKVMVDLLNVDDLDERARRAEELGADYVMVHTGIDQQMAGKDVFGDLRIVSSAVDLPIAVGGGLSLDNVVKAIAGGGEIIIVGGTITKSPEAGKIAAEFRKRLVGKGGEKAAKKEESVETILSIVSTSNVSDAMHHRGEMHGLRPVSVEKRFFGKAFTVKAYPGDWSKTVQAIDKAQRGDVIVIDAHESQVALWGELATRSALSRGIAGLVIDGGVRDVEEIKGLKFPIYARCVSPAAGEPKGMGELSVPITCGGVDVEPGDYILADRNGVVVIPKKRAMEISRRALYVKEKENRVKKEIEDGKTLGQILELGKWEKI
jgi:3-hexulose-6-phosphate synthase/6-phospho-3-hexuloisomerase